MEINELLSSYLKKVHWAFVGLTHPGNLGAILRALKNTGCAPPILIDPAKDLMVNSQQVLSRASHAKEYAHDVKLRDLETALEGSRMVIGFTARDRDIQIPKISFEETLKVLATVCFAGKIFMYPSSLDAKNLVCLTKNYHDVLEYVLSI